EYLDEVDFAHPEKNIPEIRINKTYDVDHGRVEHRFCAVSKNVDWLIKRHPDWETKLSFDRKWLYMWGYYHGY
ncbi:MAG: hypothetical protein LBV52_05995, partial [Spirochaetaceae bacterium]|nr:hypothetical protein [Spirochaetaceae bacterium]